MGESTLKEKTSKGLFWGGMSNGLQQLLSALFGIYLARTLSPEDYGLVGMLTIFSMLALALQDGGFVSALINRKGIVHDDYNAVFWFNVFCSLACYLILFLCAPLIARYFHHPELVELSRWTFLSFVFAGFGTAHRAYLSKNLMVKEMAMVGIFSVAASGLLGIYLAWKGFAYWALVFQALVLSFMTNAGYWFFSKWRPSFRLNFQPVREMLKYSVKLVVTSLLGILNSNLVTVILGRYYSAERVGFYTQANKWSMMGSNTLSGMVNSVAHPVLASVVDERERQLRVFRKMMRFASFISFPAMLGLAFIAPEFILVILKDKWTDSILLLQILSFAGAFLPMTYICTNLLLSQGRSDQYLWGNVAQFLVILVLMYLLYPLGVTAMVIGVSAANVLWLLLWTWFTRKAVGYTFWQLFVDLAPFFGFTLLAIAGAYLVTAGIGSLAWKMVAKILVTAAIYILVMWLSRSVTFKECIDYVKKRL